MSGVKITIGFAREAALKFARDAMAFADAHREGGGDAVNELRKVCQCLYLAVEPSIANDVKKAAEAVIALVAHPTPPAVRGLAVRIVGIVADALDGQNYSQDDCIEVILPMLKESLACEQPVVDEVVTVQLDEYAEQCYLPVIDVTGKANKGDRVRVVAWKA